MHPLCPPAAPHLQPEPALALGSRTVRGCRRLPCFGQRGARGCCLDLQASGERGPQGEIQPSQMQRSGCSEQGVPGTLPWGSIQTALCARLGHVCWRASSQGGFRKKKRHLVLCHARCHFSAQRPYKGPLWKIPYPSDKNTSGHTGLWKSFSFLRVEGGHL